MMVDRQLSGVTFDFCQPLENFGTFCGKRISTEAFFRTFARVTKIFDSFSISIS